MLVKLLIGRQIAFSATGAKCLGTFKRTVMQSCEEEFHKSPGKILAELAEINATTEQMASGQHTVQKDVKKGKKT